MTVDPLDIIDNMVFPASALDGRRHLTQQARWRDTVCPASALDGHGFAQRARWMDDGLLG